VLLVQERAVRLAGHVGTHTRAWCTAALLRGTDSAARPPSSTDSMRRSHQLASARRPVKTTRSSRDVHMGRLAGDAHPVQAVEAAHNATPAAYMARIRRSCRATGPGVRDSVCIAMRRPVPRPSRSTGEASVFESRSIRLRSGQPWQALILATFTGATRAEGCGCCAAGLVTADCCRQLGGTQAGPPWGATLAGRGSGGLPSGRVSTGEFGQLDGCGDPACPPSRLVTERLGHGRNDLQAVLLDPSGSAAWKDGSVVLLSTR
jgi:hypothetical protein